MKNNPLFDKNFLYELDHYRNRIIYVRLLNYTALEDSIEQIEGVATGGSITIDGASSVRRIISLTMTTKNLNINNIYWGLNAVVKVEIGIENKIESKYPNVIWFPQGTFIITEFQTNAQVNNYIINLTGKDKMCRLNGDIGGIFNAETDLGEELVWDEETQKYIKEKRSLSYIIREMIHHYAQEDFNNIIIKLKPGYDMLQNRTGLTIYLIEDLNENFIDIKTSNELEDSKYCLASSLEPVNFSAMPEDFIYKYTTIEDNTILIAEFTYATPTTILDTNNLTGPMYTVRKIEDKDDIGYRIHELTYPDELIAAAGDTITSILDKIVEKFPIYEYFYNLNGQFVFQQRQTYVNSSWSISIGNENEETYIAPMMVAKKISYDFEGNQIVTTFTNNPQLNEIKNDYTVWGKRKMPSGVEQRIHMRYAIDHRPKYYVSFDKNSDDLPVLYVTSDYYAEMQTFAIDEVKNEWLMKKTPPPDYLLNATYYSYSSYKAHPQDELVPVTYTKQELNAKWWDIMDWANYFAELMGGDLPQKQLLEYGTVGMLATFTFPDGSSVKLTDKKQNPNRPPLTVYYNQTNTTTFVGPMLIFDVYKDSQAPYLGEVRSSANGKLYGSWNPFQHGFNGCVHNYRQFYDRNSQGIVQSWIYCPQIPNDALKNAVKEIKDLELFYDIKIVDWREIIYQMANDYYAYGHDDEFYITLFHNNDLSKFNVPRIYDLNGRTGYEQYYHDIYGFWRTLYIPKYEKNKYLMSHRFLKGYRHKNFEYKGFTWDVDSNGNFINLNILQTSEEENTTFIPDSNLIGNRSQDTKNYTFYLDTNGNLINEETNEKATFIFKGKTYNWQLHHLVEQDNLLKQIKTQISNLYQQVSIIYNNFLMYANLSKNNPENLTYLNKRDQLQEEQSELLKELDNLKNKVNIIQASIGPCALFYSCDANEEKFYNKLTYTPNGYPEYVEYNATEEALIGDYNKDIVYNPQSLLFWFDFWNANNLGIGQFSVKAIGDRPIVKNLDFIPALIFSGIPNILFVNEEDYEPENEIYFDYQPFVLKKDSFYRQAIENGDITQSTHSSTAQEEIDNLLYEHSYINEKITLNTIPIYYLEPNTIISARDELQIVNGYYILNKMTIPLSFNGTMKCDCIKVPERIY